MPPALRGSHECCSITLSGPFRTASRSRLERAKWEIPIRSHSSGFDPAHLRFRYKLENYDADWSETGSRHVVFKHLPAGSYRLIAGVRDHHGPWSPNAASIEVRPTLPYVYQRVVVLCSKLATFAAASIVGHFSGGRSHARGTVSR